MIIKIVINGLMKKALKIIQVAGLNHGDTRYTFYLTIICLVSIRELWEAIIMLVFHWLLDKDKSVSYLIRE